MATKLIDINGLARFKEKHDVEIDAKISNVTIQVSTMPTASSALLGKIYQYIGTTTSTYTNGFFYKCITNNGTYIWEQTNVQPASSGSVNIIEGYYNTEDDLFYEEDTFTTEIIGAVSTIYIDLLTSKTYRWNGTEFVRLDDEYVIATDSTVGFVKPDNVTTFVDDDGTLRTKVWAGTLERYNIEKDKIPNDTTIIIVDGDESESGDGYVNGIKIVSWGDGTDEEIAAMIAGADEGKINLTDYWSVGDERTVHLSAMTGKELNITQPAQDVVLVLMNEGYPGNPNVHFVWGQKDCLSRGEQMNINYTNTGSWDNCIMRSTLNYKYYNALPTTFRNCLKQFNVITAETYNGSTNQVSQDYISLFAEKEIFGSASYSNTTEASALSQIEYYKTSSNRVKQRNGSSAWWVRSPVSNNAYYFCLVDSEGDAHTMGADVFRGVAPFGCI